jgi:hypothetical protein
MNRRQHHIPILGASALLMALVLAACGGDSDPTGPGPGSVSVDFRPDSRNLTLTAGDEMEFRIEVEGSGSYTVAWRYGLQTATTDTFRVVADQVGVDTVWSTVVTSEREQGEFWHVEVVPDLSNLPRDVSGLTLAHGPGPAEVIVSWLRSSPTTYPLVAYEIGVSYDGPLTNANWEQRAFSVTVPHPGQPVRPDTTVTNAEHGLLPGERAWFAVRAVDELGQLSLIKESYPWDVTYPWRLDVHVQGDAGQPLPGVILIYGPDDARAATDAAGNANLGPFRNIDTVPVATRFGDQFYDYTVPARDVDDGPLLVTLIEKHDLDLVDCGAGGNPAATFMQYLQYATRTDRELEHRPNRELYRWREYPVLVHFAERDTVVDQITYHLADSLRSAMEIWNDHLGFQIMAETVDAGAADVLCTFDLVSTSLLGLVQSADGGDNLEQTIPRLFTLQLDLEGIFEGGFNTLAVTEVALHEFGHVLGIYEHTCSSGKGNLMDNGGAVGSLADGPAHAISLTEMRAVRAISNLPQSIDMSGYELDPPPAR